MELGIFILGLSLLTALPGCLQPTGSERSRDQQAVWVIVERDEVAQILALTEIGDARVVESNADQAIVEMREAKVDALADYFHHTYRRCGGFTAHASLDAARATLAAEATATRRVVAEPLEPSHPEVVNALIAKVDAGRILTTIAGLSAFPSRHYQSQSGVDAALWLRDRWAAMAAGRADTSVELYEHADWAQPSVILTIAGDELADEVVVLGGHLDSISFFGNTAPGADDDASGVATLGEVARIILTEDIQFERTVVLIAYAAEEVGLRGSGEIAAEYAAEGIPVAGVMQLDMTNYNGSAEDIVFITDNTDPAQTAFAGTLADAYLPELAWTTDACGYACSDHASWHREGFATVFPFEATLSDYNPTIHTPDDTLEVSDSSAEHAAKFAKLAVAYVVEMAKVDGDDMPEPDPGAALLAQVGYDVPGLDHRGEFVDVHNNGDEPLDLTGWTLGDRESLWTFPAGTILPAHGFLSLARDAAGFESLYRMTADVSGLSLALSNSGDELFLRDASGMLMDFVAWERSDWPLEAKTGETILRTAETDTDTAADFSIDTTPTPLGGTATQP